MRSSSLEERAVTGTGTLNNASERLFAVTITSESSVTPAEEPARADVLTGLFPSVVATSASTAAGRPRRTLTTACGMIRVARAATVERARHARRHALIFLRFANPSLIVRDSLITSL